MSTKLPPLNKELVEILGRQCFQCGSIAAVLRVGLMDIAHRAEDEQAAVIHWLLSQYLEQPENWKERVNKLLKEMVPDPVDGVTLTDVFIRANGWVRGQVSVRVEDIELTCLAWVVYRADRPISHGSFFPDSSHSSGCFAAVAGPNYQELEPRFKGLSLSDFKVFASERFNSKESQQ